MKKSMPYFIIFAIFLILWIAATVYTAFFTNVTEIDVGGGLVDKEYALNIYAAAVVFAVGLPVVFILYAIYAIIHNQNELYDKLYRAPEAARLAMQDDDDKE